MLAALIAYLFLSGGATGPMDYLNTAVDRLDQAVVDDSSRRTADKILDAMVERTEGHDDLTASLAEQLVTLVEAGGDDAEVEAVWQQFFDADVEYADAMMDLRFALRDRLTREEWQALFSE